MPSAVHRPAAWAHPILTEPRRWLTENESTGTEPPLNSARSSGLSSLAHRTIRVADPNGRLVLEVSWEGDEPPWLRGAVETLVELRGLPENWNSYGARAIEIDAIGRALDMLTRIMRRAIPNPQIVPTHMGGVQLEWHSRGVDLEIELTHPQTCAVYYLNHTSGEEWERELASADLSALEGPISALTRPA